MLSILTWWRNWRARSRRNLFEFFDGKRFRKADPWPIWRQLYNDPEFIVGKDRDDPTGMLEAAMRLEEPAFSKCVACAHRALGTKPFDSRTGEGLGETEVVAVVWEFLMWCDVLLKKTGCSLNWSPPARSKNKSTAPC